MTSSFATSLQEYVPLITTGKVRELYELDNSTLLFVATDKVSAFDAVLANTVHQKGSILTQISEFWFRYLRNEIPNLQNHLISTGLPSSLRQRIGPELATQLEPRSMVVKKVKVLPIESIVRGYLTGSLWASYKEHGSFCGISLPSGKEESQKLDQAIWTPSTKAEAGEHDENISPEEVVEILNNEGFDGDELTPQIEKISLLIYEKASVYAAEQGIIIADTKFEFGIDESVQPPSVVLVDEVLTPDSSRFWRAAEYEIGRSQQSLDKQPLRDWLVQEGKKGEKGVSMTERVIENTSNRYKEAYRMLLREQWKDK